MAHVLFLQVLKVKYLALHYYTGCSYKTDPVAGHKRGFRALFGGGGEGLGREVSNAR